MSLYSIQVLAEFFEFVQISTGSRVVHRLFGLIGNWLSASSSIGEITT